MKSDKQNGENCFFLTSRYPFGKTESFIENEIDFLSKFFKNIYIFSLDSGKGAVRNIPNNITVFSLNMWGGLLSKIRKVITGFFGHISDLSFEGTGLKSRVHYWLEKGMALLIFKKMNRIILKNNISTSKSVFYSYWMDSKAAAISLLKKKNEYRKCLFICRSHGADLYSERTSFNYLPLQRFCMSSLDYVFPISYNGEQYLKDKYPTFSNKIFHFYLGTKDKGKTNRTIKNPVRFVTCSNLIPLKQLVLFAKAFCNLNKNIKAEWVCIGSGSQEAAIKKAVSNCKDAVTFMGRLANDEVLRFYANNDVSFFVNVSKYEGLPVSIMECFSFGIPAIATNVGATKEIVDGNNGFLINDINQLEEVLTKACQMKEKEYVSFSKNARLTWERKFNSDVNYEKFYSFLMNQLYEMED